MGGITVVAEAGEIKVLVTWGQIETHLGKTRKTIIDHGYPVHKGPRGGIFAFSDELDSHRRSMPLRAEVVQGSSK